MKMEGQRILGIDAPVGRHQSRCDAGCTPHGPDAFGHYAGLWRLRAASVTKGLPKRFSVILTAVLGYLDHLLDLHPALPQRCWAP
jgi:hypothetical protein